MEGAISTLRHTLRLLQSCRPSHARLLSTISIDMSAAKAAAACWDSTFSKTVMHAYESGSWQGVPICYAGNKVVEYTDRTAAEVDEMIKERQERNKVLREP